MGNTPHTQKARTSRPLDTPPRIRVVAIGALLALATLLAACGAVGSSYARHPTANTTPIPGSAALNGCQTQHPPTSRLPAATLLLTDGASSSPTPAATLPPTVVTTGVASPVATTYVNTTPQAEATAAVSGTAVVSTPGAHTSVPPGAQNVTAHVGQTLEVRLRASIQWALTLMNAQHALTLHYAKSWYDAAHQACVWRFTASQRGLAHLDFTGGLVCPRDAPCPAIAAIQSFAVTVK